MNHMAASYPIKPRLGQHFLKNEAVFAAIVLALDLRKEDAVIEIGPGHGELTKHLMEHPASIIAVEKDAELYQKLISSDFNQTAITFVHGDILKILPELITNYHLPIISYKLVGNIPYYITGFLLRTLSELPHKPTLSVLTIQKEVAERMCAEPPHMNILAASVQYWAKPEILQFIPKKDFSPPPKVDSAVIRLVTKNEQRASALYYPFIRTLFKQPRKTIRNNLYAAVNTLGVPENEIDSVLSKLGIDPNARPQNLSLELIENIVAALRHT